MILQKPGEAVEDIFDKTSRLNALKIMPHLCDYWYSEAVTDNCCVSVVIVLRLTEPYICDFAQEAIVIIPDSIDREKNLKEPTLVGQSIMRWLRTEVDRQEPVTVFECLTSSLFRVSVWEAPQM